MLIGRGQIVTGICEHLRIQVPDLKLVKPYHGELDRYSKKTQLEQEIFPAQVNLTTPFALIISKNRERDTKQGASTKWLHSLSVYIGVQNTHDFNSIDVPPIFALMDKVTTALNGHVFFRGAGALTVESDGEYLITTDLFTVYDQRYFQHEIGN